MLQNAIEIVKGRPEAFLIVLTGILLLSRLRTLKRVKLDVPELPSHGLQDNRDVIQHGFVKYSKANQPYYLEQPHHDILVLPPNLMVELRSFPENQVSFREEIFDRFNGRWTGLGKDKDTSVIPLVRGDITRHIGRLLNQMFDECNHAFPQEIGAPEDWIAIPMYMKVVRIVALLTGRTFIGLPISRNEKWLRVIIFHTRQVFACSEDLWRYPRWIRNFVAPFTKGVRDLEANLKITKEMVRPKLKERMKLLKTLDSGTKPPDDSLQWIIDNAPPGKHDDIEFHATQQLGLSVAAIHTTGMNITQNLFDLAAYPEYQSILRSEILSTFTNENGIATVTKQAITKLRKLDSFIRESQRLNPPSLASMNRKVTNPSGITLSNGFHLPFGTFIGTSGACVARDPSLWDNPTAFDGLRFYKLRQQPGNENKHQFVATGHDHLVFGHGTHACPGRFFASNEIKIFLMYTLLNYELKLEDGQTDRPANVSRGLSVLPNPTTKICWRTRTSEMRLVGLENDA